MNLIWDENYKTKICVFSGFIFQDKLNVHHNSGQSFEI